MPKTQFDAYLFSKCLKMEIGNYDSSILRSISLPSVFYCSILSLFLAQWHFSRVACAIGD